MRSLFVAEVKTISPFGFKSNYSELDLITMAIANADMIAIHTEPLWDGSKGLHFEYLARQCHNNGIKVLAKGLHTTDDEIKNLLNRGADYVLVVGRIPAKKYLKKCWLEPVVSEQNASMLAAKPHAIVFNARDLRTGLDSTNYIPIGSKKKGSPLFIQASKITSIISIKDWADGYIVGEHLPQFIVSKQIERINSKYEV